LFTDQHSTVDTNLNILKLNNMSNDPIKVPILKVHAVVVLVINRPSTDTGVATHQSVGRFLKHGRKN